MSGPYHRYDSYRDSGVLHLGAVPRNWKTKQLKRSLEGCVNGTWGGEPTGGSEDIVVLRVADFDRQHLTIGDGEYTQRAIPEIDRRRRLLKGGDLLLEKSGGGEKTHVGQVVIFDRPIEAVCSNFVAKMTPLDGYDGAYLNYTFSALYRDGVNSCSIKQNTGIQNLDSNRYLAEHWAFPCNEEQAQIAKFLDYETAKIDALIEKQQQLIALLREKRQAVISHAVTKGLNPDALMRDSGVEWLGEVPAHWTISLPKYFCTRIIDGPHHTPNYVDEGVPFVTVKNLTSGTGICLEDTKRITPKNHAEFIKRAHPEVGDLLITKDGTLGVTRVIETDREFSIFVSVALIKLNRVLADPYFLQHCFESNGTWAQFTVMAAGAALQHIVLSTIANVKIPLPPLPEQVMIGRWISSRCSKLDALNDKAIEQVQLLQERRSALISAAVTGKIDVRGWKPPTSDSDSDSKAEAA